MVILCCVALSGLVVVSCVVSSCVVLTWTCSDWRRGNTQAWELAADPWISVRKKSPPPKIKGSAQIRM